MTADLVYDNTGNVQFAYNRNRGLPWHKLGTAVEEDLDLVAMLEVAGLNRSVTKQPLLIMTSAGITTCTTHEAVVLGATERDGERIVGVNSPGYGIHTPEEVFSYGEAVAEVSGACWDTMGMLAGGSRFFGFLRQEPFVLDPNGVNDRIDRGILIASSFDGSLSSVGFATAVRAVCANTVAAGMAAGSRMFAIKHTKNSADRLRFAQKVVESADSYLAAFSAQAEELLRINDTGGLFGKVLDTLYPVPENASARSTSLVNNAREAIAQLYVGPTNAGAVGHNGWAILNAFTEYLDHEATVRITDSTVKAADFRTQAAYDTAKDKARELRKAERALFGEQDGEKLRIAMTIKALATV